MTTIELLNLDPNQKLDLTTFFHNKDNVKKIPYLSRRLLERIPYRAGNISAPIVVIGEAPGFREEQTGLPFVGPSGKLLRRYIKGDTYITNVLKVRPPNNDFNAFLVQHPKEVAYNVLLLAAELQHTYANVYVAVGETALNVLTGKSGITKYRGSILEATLPTIKGRKVIPIIHPAAVLRNWKDFFPLFVLDAKRVVEDSKFPELNIPKRKYIIRPTVDDVARFISKLLNDEDAGPEKVVAFDLETKNYTIASIQFCNNAYEAIAIPFMVHGGYSYWSEADELMVWEMVKKVLYTKRLIGQNIMSFDIPVLFAHGFDPFRMYENVVFDTMLAIKCYEPQLPAGLDFLTSVYTREPYYKDDIKEWKNEQEDTFWIYGCKDVLVLQEIYPQLKKDLEDDGKLEFYYEWYHKLAKYQLQMTVRGMKVDKEKRNELEKVYMRDIIYNQAQLVLLAGEPINVNSPSQLKRFLHEKLKLPQVVKDGKVTTNRNALLKLSAKYPSDVFAYMLKVREMRKLYSTNIRLVLDSDGKYRAMFGFTETGRFTSSKWPMGTGGNTQNIPKKMRVMFVPEDGYVFLGCDGSQAEARVVAWYANEEKLKEIFKSGGDIHSQVAALIFDKKVEDVDKDTERYIAKRVVHASNYGMGPTKFAMSFNVDVARFNLPLEMLTVEKARDLQVKYYSTFKMVKEGYQRKIIEQVASKKGLENPFGRRIRFHDRLGNELYREAFAWLAQSTVADFTNSILKRVSDELVLVNQEHDGLLFMVKESEVEDAIRYIKENAQIVLFDDLVIPLEFKVGTSWGDMEEVGV